MSAALISRPALCRAGSTGALEPRFEAVASRLTALEALESDYPWIEALGARAASDGDWGEAARFYRLAAERRPGEPRLRANLAFAEAKAAR